MIKVSIITTVYNNRQFIASAIKSVLNQTYKNIEHIVVDGGSKDGTVEIINQYRDKIAKFISERDRGIYDGMNKGLKMATGEIIGTLNSDDIYAANDVVETVVKTMTEKKVDVCWGDLVYVDKDNTDKVIRLWKSSAYKKGKFKWGWMPPHPTFFVRKEIYDKYGIFNLDFKIAADYELMLRFLEKYKVSSCYIPKVVVKMRKGGESNRNLFKQIKHHIEDYRAWQVNGFCPNPLSLFLKPVSKIPQYFKKS